MTDKFVINRRDTLALIIGATAASAFGGRALAAEPSLSFWATHTGTPELKQAMQGLCDAFAKEKGVKCSINPDAHSVHGLQAVIYGIKAARKGWLTRKDVINCLPLGQIEDALRAKRER